MLLVLLIHFVPVHLEPSPQTLSSEPFSTVVNLILRSVSFVCVNCFILISGYFGIRWKIRSFANLLFQILFWLALGVAFWAVAGLEYQGSVAKACLSMLNSRWFIPAYIALYVLSPVLNAFVERTSTKELFSYLLAFYAFSTFFGYFMFSREFNEGMSLISLVGIYLTGAYLRREDMILSQWTARRSICAYLISAGILAVASLAIFKLGVGSSLYGYLNPVIIVQSVFLFLFFKNINIGNRRWINFVAASAFSVYLFHMHPLVYGKYQEVCRFLIDETIPAITVPALFVAIFVFCVCVDNIRIFIFNQFSKIIK